MSSKGNQIVKDQTEDTSLLTGWVGMLSRDVENKEKQVWEENLDIWSWARDKTSKHQYWIGNLRSQIRRKWENSVLEIERSGWHFIDKY